MNPGFLLMPLLLAQPSSTSVSVKVGEEKHVSVGLARGLICDDPEIASVSFSKGSKESNELSVKGNKVGHTLCRAGNSQAGSVVTVDITVVPKG